MSLEKCHAKPDDLNKYSTIITTDLISFAEFIPNGNNTIRAFEHKHEDYEFIIPFNTIPLLSYQDADYLGDVGYCYPVNPNVTHGIEFDLNSRLLSIVVDKNYLNKIKEELNFKGKYFYTKFLLSKDLLIELAKIKISIDDETIENIVKTLVLCGLKDDIDNRKPKKIYFKRIKQSIIYMVEHFEDPDLTIKAISEESEYSYTYFTKAFTLYMHITPVAYLNKLRLSKAKELMKDKMLTLGDICKQSGFNNMSTFTESFKRTVGMLPKDYRKKYIE